MKAPRPCPPCCLPALLFTLLSAALLAGCASQAPRDATPPIVFVHGNGEFHY